MMGNSKRSRKRKSVILAVETNSQSIITFDRDKVLGQGDNTVYEGAFNGNVCAVKRILKTHGEQRDKIAEDMLREVTVWLNLCKDTLQLNIPIVRCYGFEQNEDFWTIACEKFQGNLGQLILKEVPFKTHEVFPIEILRGVALQAAEGLQFIHEKGYVHKDIKPRNFVVRRGNDEKGEIAWVCKLTDMGFTKRTIEGGSWASRTSNLGTRSWGLAPELLIKEGESTDEASGSSDRDEKLKLSFNQRSDVWAMGLVIHFIFSGGGHPYGKTENQWLQNIRDGKPTEEGKRTLKEISSPRMGVDVLVEQMIRPDADNRPDMNNVVSTINGWLLSAE